MSLLSKENKSYIAIIMIGVILGLLGFLFIVWVFVMIYLKYFTDNKSNIKTDDSETIDDINDLFDDI